MIILIDSGNSRLKVGWLDAGNPAQEREPAVVAFEGVDLDALAEWLTTLPRSPQLAIGVNVAGDARAAAITVILQRHACPVRWVRAQLESLGLINGYKQPEQLGADRWASLLGVRARLPAVHPPFLLASFGTATTIDTVGADNVFAGGLILPGPAMMRNALMEGTANLPLANGQVVAYPTDTHEAIASGIAAAQAGAVVRQWLAGRRRFGQAPSIFAAGGGWPEVQQEIERLLADAGDAFGDAPVAIYLDHPVLDGLAALARSTQARLP